jgi:hypothetical protein
MYFALKPHASNIIGLLWWLVYAIPAHTSHHSVGNQKHKRKATKTQHKKKEIEEHETYYL